MMKLPLQLMFPSDRKLHVCLVRVVVQPLSYHPILCLRETIETVESEFDEQEIQS